MPVVYKLRRSDGKEYIGITVNLKRRLKEHKQSQRFRLGIDDVQILLEGSYEECSSKERGLIAKHDTFNTGLNLTVGGKGAHHSDNFTTYGFKFSEESRKKMSDSAKKSFLDGKVNGMVGKKHTEETKKKWSEIRKGVSHNKKANFEEVREMYSSRPKIPAKFVLDIVKKSMREKVVLKEYGEQDLEGLIGSGGRPLSYNRLFCRVYSDHFGVCGNALHNVITNKVVT